MEVNFSMFALLLLTSITAYFIKGLVGFGPSLLLVPILSLFVDFKSAVVIATMADISSGLIIVIKERKRIHLHKIFVIALGLMIGTLLGVSLFNLFSMHLLKRLYGIMLIFLVLQSVIKKQHEPEVFHKVKAFFAGFLGGICGGLFNTNGPPIVMYLNKVVHDHKFLRSNISAIFAVDALWRGFLFWQQGLLATPLLKLYLALILPGLLVGLYLGNKSLEKINKKTVSSFIEMLLFTIGCGMLFR